MMLHPKVGGYWLNDIGPFGDVSYSENWQHGCESASWAMAPGTRHHALRPGASVGIFDGCVQVWSGLLVEPGRDGSFDAEGSWSRGAGALAIDLGSFSTNRPQTAIDAAIALGAVPWTRVTAIDDNPIGENSIDLTLNALLDRYSERVGSKIRVNHHGYVEELAAPTSPTWAVLLAEDLWSRSNDDYVTHLNVIYTATGPTDLAFVHTTDDSATFAAISGPRYATLDLRNMGVIALADAEAYADAKFVATGPRMVLTQPVQLATGQLRTLGDTPAGWSAVHAGQSIRIWGMPNRSGPVPVLHTDFTIGRVERTETSLTLAPQGLPPTNTRDVIAAITPAAAASE